MMLQQVRETPGFAMGLRLSAPELADLKAIITDHLAGNVRQINPDLEGLIRSTPLERYHEIAARLPHAQLLTRAARILPQAAVDRIRRMSLFTQLQREFGDFTISDEEGMGRESISIRLVRPGQETDVGSLHNDDWFWTLYDFPVPQGLQRVKLWMAICCEPGKGGLMLSPESHKREWKYSVIERAGMKKPLIDPTEKPELQMFRSEPGEAVTFNYKLLHGGAVTTGTLTRVSMEFTLLVNDKTYRAGLPEAAVH